MAEAAATGRAPGFFQRLPKVVRTGQARLLLGCIPQAEAAPGGGSLSHDPGALFPAGGGSGVSREGEGTGGDPSRGSLARAGQPSLQLFSMCGEPSGHREGPLLAVNV